MLTKRIAFIGGACSGKTVLAMDATVALKKRGRNVEYIQEWVRGDIAEHGPMEHVNEQYRILAHNLREESKHSSHTEYVLIDGGCLTGYFYTALYGTAARDRLAISEMYETFVKFLFERRYHLIFVVDRMPVARAGVDHRDGIRVQTEEQLAALDEFIKLMLLKVHKMDHHIAVDCALGQRTDFVLKTIEEFERR